MDGRVASLGLRLMYCYNRAGGMGKAELTCRSGQESGKAGAFPGPDDEQLRVLGFGDQYWAGAAIPVLQHPARFGMDRFEHALKSELLHVVRFWGKEAFDTRDSRRPRYRGTDGAGGNVNDADVGVGEPGVAGSPLEGCLRRSRIVKADDYLVFQHDASFLRFN
jgi:hypothetical protein